VRYQVNKDDLKSQVEVMDVGDIEAPNQTKPVSFVNIVNCEKPKKKINFIRLDNNQRVENTDFEVPLAAIEGVKHRKKNGKRTNHARYVEGVQLNKSKPKFAYRPKPNQPIGNKPCANDKLNVIKLETNFDTLRDQEAVFSENVVVELSSGNGDGLLAVGDRIGLSDLFSQLTEPITFFIGSGTSFIGNRLTEWFFYHDVFTNGTPSGRLILHSNLGMRIAGFNFIFFLFLRGVHQIFHLIILLLRNDFSQLIPFSHTKITKVKRVVDIKVSFIDAPEYCHCNRIVSVSLIVDGDLIILSYELSLISGLIVENKTALVALAGSCSFSVLSSSVYSLLVSMSSFPLSVRRRFFSGSASDIFPQQLMDLQ
nr:hypothetical protein [Tanacetum cinerariifolium]